MSIGPPPPALPPTDPYGLDIAFDATGDIRITQSGSLGLVTGVYNAAQAIFLRFKTQPGEVPLHPLYGSQLGGSLIGAKTNITGIVQEANADLAQMLSDDPRFNAASVLNYTRPASTNYPESVALSIQATLAGGEQLILSNVTDPSPSDVSLPQFVDPTIDPTLTYDPLAEQEFFADQPEFDTLQDLNSQQSIIDDYPGSSILGTGG